MSDPVTVSTGAMLMRVGLALALVLGIFAAVLYLYRRASRAGARPRDTEKIELVAQRSLGARSSIALVRVAGEAFLVGVTPQQITRLGTLAEGTRRRRARAAEAMDSLPGGPDPAAPAPPPPGPFERRLDDELARACGRLARRAPAAELPAARMEV